MKITEFGVVSSPTDIRRKRLTGSSSASSFADLLSVDAESDTATASLSDISATNGIGNMLALQEVGEEATSRKKLLQRGKTLIEMLEKLRQQLLIGEVPLSTLTRLARELSAHREATYDPHLLALMDDIELRAAVELAKLEMANKPTE